MLADLKDDGFHVSLLATAVFRAEKQIVPRTGGKKPRRARRARAICLTKTPCWIFPIRKTVEWYQGKLASLLKMGVSAIKVDFGEAAPDRRHLRRRPHRLLRAQSVSAALQQGRRRHHQTSHRRKHHLGAQRVGGQPALSDALGRRRGKHRRRHGGGIARRACRSAFPDFRSGATTSAVSRRIRSTNMDKDLFARWLAFGMLSSHSRCHGIAPKEPWNYGSAFHGRIPHD